MLLLLVDLRVTTGVVDLDTSFSVSLWVDAAPSLASADSSSPASLDDAYRASTTMRMTIHLLHQNAKHYRTWLSLPWRGLDSIKQQQP